MCVYYQRINTPSPSWQTTHINSHSAAHSYLHQTPPSNIKGPSTRSSKWHKSNGSTAKAYTCKVLMHHEAGHPGVSIRYLFAKGKHTEKEYRFSGVWYYTQGVVCVQTNYTNNITTPWSTENVSNGLTMNVYASGLFLYVIRTTQRNWIEWEQCMGI